MNAKELRSLAIKNNPDADILTAVYKKLKELALIGKFEYRHYPDALPDYALKELKKEGYKITVQKGECNSTDTTISWD